MSRTKEAFGFVKGSILIGASFLVLTPELTGLADLDPQLRPGFLALSISIGFALSVMGGYVIAASARRKEMQRAAMAAGVALVYGLIMMVLLAEGESPQFHIARTIALAGGVLLGGYLRAPRPLPPINLVPLTDTERRVHIQRRIAASHDYTRHIVSNLINWYTFFVGVNYASMGWFATREEGVSNKIVLIAAMFIMQNVLGIMACMRIKRYILSTSDEIVADEQSLVGERLTDEAREALIPSSVYSRAIQLMVTGLIFIVLVWAALPFFMEENVAIDFVEHLFY